MELKILLPCTLVEYDCAIRLCRKVISVVTFRYALKNYTPWWHQAKNCTLSQNHQLKNNIFFNTEYLQTGIMIFLFSYLGQSGSTSTIKLVMQVQQLCKCLSFTTVNEPITHTHTTLNTLLPTSLHEKRPLKVKSHSSGIQWIPL